MTSAATPNQSLTDGTARAPDRAAGSDGTAPAGMWWVAWRQQRLSLAVCGGLLAAVAATLMIFRVSLVNRIRELTDGALSECTWVGGPCPDRVYGTIQGEYSLLWSLLQLGMLVLPLMLGAFVGAPLFAREFEQRTQVWVLTQSISRLWWWATKVVVAGTPVVLAMIGIGMLMDWAGSPFGFDWTLMATPAFETRGLIPAAFTLLAIAVGVTAGIVVRSTVIGLIIAIVVAGLLVVALSLLRPHLLTPERVVTPIQLAGSGASSYQTGPGWSGIYPSGQNWYLDSGYLDAAGSPVGYTGGCPAVDNSPVSATDETIDRLWAQCQAEQGIVSQYVSYLPAERRTALQLAIVGIVAAVSAAILGVGAFRLRRRVL